MSKKTSEITRAEDLYRFELLRSPRISPDGRHVVYSLVWVEKDTEKKYNNLWVVSTAGGKPRQFTYGKQNDYAPEWSPDGLSIAFLSNRGESKDSAQVYLIPFDGGESRQLSSIEGDIGSIQWSPDGKQLLLAVQKTDPDELARQKDDKKRELGVVQRHYKRLFYKLDGAGYNAQERTHLWTLNVSSGKARQITDHEIYDEESPTWSPDSKTIAFVSNRAKDPDLDTYANALYTVPARGGEFKKIDATRGHKVFPTYSPDGKWIAYFGSHSEKEWWRNTNLWLVASDGKSAPVNLTETHDFTTSAESINDLGGQDYAPPFWSPDSSRIFFGVDRHGRTTLKSIGIDGQGLATHVDGDGVIGHISVDKNAGKASYFWSTMTDPGQVCVVDLQTNEVRELTKLNGWLKKMDLGSFEEVWFKGGNGNDLQGWILFPPGFDPKKKYPSILEIHGGPLAQYAFHFMHEFYYLAAQGYVVHFCNPRGGSGYGEDHAKAIFGKWGTVDYDDVSAWTDLVAKKPYIDKKRMGVTGGSYGGYMTLWIIGHTQRFKAAVAQRVLSNFISMWGSSDFNWSFQEVINDLPPYKDPMNAWDRSPLKYIENAKTPTLIIHSEQDHRTPIEQGEQAFVALKTLGVDTEFVRFPDSPHGLSRTGRTDRRIARLNHILRWFEKYLNS